MSTHLVPFVSACPMVPSRDILKTLEFYKDKLGFEVTFTVGMPVPEYAGVRRDQAEMHFFLCKEQTVFEWTAYRIGVRYIELLYRQCLEQALVHTSGELSDKRWGTKEFTVFDPDGVAVTFWERSYQES